MISKKGFISNAWSTDYSRHSIWNNKLHISTQYFYLLLCISTVYDIQYILCGNLEKVWPLGWINHNKITWKLQTRFNWVCTWGIKKKGIIRAHITSLSGTQFSIIEVRESTIYPSETFFKTVLWLEKTKYANKNVCGMLSDK
jgi:hypothetical protein